MIIRNATGDDLTRIKDMEAELCSKHGGGKKLLYAALRHSDFHATYEDPPEHWTAPAYAAFSGILLTHKLGFDQLKTLYSDFDVQRLLLGASWAAVIAGEKPLNRTYRDHV